MNENNLCPTCGKPLPADAPMGVCPNCLIAVTGETGAEDEPASARAFDPPAPDELAEKFPDLEIIELIGRGGMGAVYKARQRELDRLVALKILPPGIGDDPAFAERFTREARALAKLNHPHIVTLYEFGCNDGIFFFLMEFIDGVNLRQAMSAGRFTPDEALAIVPPVCEALQTAHEHGIVHRDIKPENLLLDKDGQVKIADFGVATMVGQRAASQSPVTKGDREEEGEPSLPAGTPRYMAPEQTEDPEHADHRVDIYAMGVVLYELLTGETPQGDFAPPSKRVQVDVRIDEIVLRALEKEPELRFPTAAAFRTQVETVAVSGSDSEMAKPEESSQWLRPRNWWLPALLAYTLNSLCAMLVYTEEAGDFDSLFGELFWFTSVFSLIGFSFLIFTCWRALPEEYRSTSPYKAIGFLYIPFFNFYWAFVAYGELAEGFVRYGKDRSDSRIRDARQVAMWYAISFVLWFVLGFFGDDWPVANAIFYLADLALFVGFFRAMIANAECIESDPGSELTADRIQGWAALGFAGLSGLLGAATMVQMPDPPEALIWAILAAALAGLILAVPVRRIQPGRSAFTGACVNIGIWIVITALFAFFGQTHFKSARVIEHHKREMENAWERMQLMPGKEKWEEEYDSRRDALVEAGYLQKRVFNIAAPFKSPEYRELVTALMEKSDGKPVCSWSPGNLSTQVMVWVTGEEMSEWEALLSKWKWLDTHPHEIIPAIREGGFSPTDLGFGPVIELTLEQVAVGNRCFIDLDRGRALTPPDEIGALFEKHLIGLNDLHETEHGLKILEWLRSSGADILADGRAGLFLFEGAAISPPKNPDFKQWHPGFFEVEARNVVEQIKRQPASEIDLIQPHMDQQTSRRWDTFQFRTREGGIGVLQILGSVTDPKGVKLHLKHVQSAALALADPPRMDGGGFGPEKAVSLPLVEGPDDLYFFDFETGLQVECEDPPSELPAIVLEEWLDRTGADAFAEMVPEDALTSDAGLARLNGSDFGTVFVPETEESFESVRGEEAADRLAAAENPDLDWHLSGSSNPYWFITRGGQMGIVSAATLVEADRRANFRYKLVENIASASRIRRFVPEPGIEKKTNWMVVDQPSELNPDGWFVMAHLALGGVAKPKLPGAEKPILLNLVKGDHEAVTVEVTDQERGNTMTFDLVRDRPAQMSLNGKGYRLLYPTRTVAADVVDTTALAMITVKPVEGETHRADTPKRQRFEPKSGMDKETHWSLYDKPSHLNPDGWAFYTRMTLGGTAWLKFPDEEEHRAELTLQEGDDDGLTLRIEDLKRKNTIRLSLIRNRPAEVTIDGAGYRVLYLEIFADPGDPDTTSFAHVVVTPAGQPKMDAQTGDSE